MKKAVVIGGGFAGLSAASYLAKAGFKVQVLEKNNQLGGRARQFEAKGFTFDMGPSWYWMPDVFEQFYNNFDRTTSDFYELKKLSPAYRVFWKNHPPTDIPDNLEGILDLFESIEKGSSKRLKAFLKQAKFKYEVGMKDFVYKPSLSISEFFDLKLIQKSFRLDLFQSMAKHVRKFVQNPRLIQLLEFPILFLGAVPNKIPALYSLMNYADYALGTWYPMGGMHKIVDAFSEIAKVQGVDFQMNTNVEAIKIKNKIAYEIQTNNKSFKADVVVSAADYHFVEQNLIEKKYRKYKQNYWEKRILAPSCLLYYLGLNKKIEGLKHHNLFFDADFDLHGKQIYETHEFPSEPLFYVCCPSKTDHSVAPIGKENLFILIPISIEIEDNEITRQKYLNIVLDRMEKQLKVELKSKICYQKTYAKNDFITDYNAYKGNAYGLANTLNQTAILKPKIKTRKIDNLYFCGQMTSPGPGVPPSIISGKVVSDLILKNTN